MHKAKSIFIDLLALFIITVPAFMRILGGQYFSMHDDQHPVRLFLLDQGIRQGYLYPRWVDGLGFGFGYPLFNFYPPLIYYLGEFFHLLGFSLIWSIKLVFIFGFLLGAAGMYLLIKRFTNRIAGLLAATLYTYFFYHAVLIYVRGALAEFFSMALLPFVFLFLEKLLDEPSLKNALKFGIIFALLILCHPLIALPGLIFVGLIFLFYLFKSKVRLKLTFIFICSLILGVGLSAFFWLPSLAERKFTLTDQILTGELASYKLHYIYPQQLFSSVWGYGGSGPGLSDGVTFQLGKVQLGLAVLALILCLIYIFNKKQFTYTVNFFLLSFFLLLFSIYMSLEYSSFIWDGVKYLWYLQFPWRFLTFTAVFISVTGAFCIFFLGKAIEQLIPDKNMINRLIIFIAAVVVMFFTVITYQKYFKPQRHLQTGDQERTTVEEISWRISRSSYEFVPRGVRTKKSELNTTILDINKAEIPKTSYAFDKTGVLIKEIKNKFNDKQFTASSPTSFYFRLNTYSFPGWTVYIDNKKTAILDNNRLKLMVINVPKGDHEIKFKFENTPIRNVANLITIVSIIGVGILLLMRRSSFKK